MNVLVFNILNTYKRIKVKAGCVIQDMNKNMAPRVENMVIEELLTLEYH